ncbi:HD domain-containing phosphohydrolase [Colwellia echini]|uniref:Transporter substrate-binding domain-containing protein n=1 Tax=Colwellia echini TaxID=1982103 RepID=A0ABY3MUK6_9GAMM|nr:HD domain-containing phosphohydrolase [Colwellia echini]TYK64747.1 transporter substrate-binding domain-containing protein [Colwellia echini]
MKQRSIRFVVVSIFILATFITAAIAIGLQYHFSKSIATESARQLFLSKIKGTINHLESTDDKAKNLSEIFAQFEDLVFDGQFEEKTFKVLTKILNIGPGFYSVYVGSDNGDLSQIINLNSGPTVRSQLNATLNDRWVYINIQGPKGNKTSTTSYLNSNFEVRTSKTEKTNFDPTTRPWFTHASKNAVYKSEPYLFHYLNEPGQAYSTKIPDGKGVFAVDFTLSSVKNYLEKQGRNEQDVTDKEIYLFQKTGEIIASNQHATLMTELNHVNKVTLTAEQVALVAATPPLNVSNETDWAPIDFSISGKPMGYSIDLLNIISQMTGLTFSYQNGYTWTEFLQGFDKGDIDILQPIFDSSANRYRGLLSTAFVDLPFAIVTLDNVDVISDLKGLNGKSLGVLQNSTLSKNIKQQYPEINLIELPSTRAVIQAVKKNEVYAGIDSEAILNYTEGEFFINGLKHHKNINSQSLKINSSLHFMVKPAQQNILAIINLAIKSLTTEQKVALYQKWLVPKGDIKTVKHQAVVPYKELLTLSKKSDTYNKLAPITINGKECFVLISPVNSSNSEFLAIVVDKNTVMAPSLQKVKMSIIITTLCLLLILPISWLFSRPIVSPIKLLALENEKIKHRHYDDVVLVKTHIKEIDGLANSLVDMSVAIKDHELQQQELMDSFIKLIAQTIDDKSAYTGGHCNRVPELGLMLVDEVVKDDNTFKDFAFESDDAYREFKISAWLHDCGKIITPEHIVDKGSKLEAIYNRIHEVRMRFEVLWRDAEITYYQALIKDPAEQESLHQALIATQKKLIQDFSFVANANVGGEFMAEDKVERLQVIGQQTWQRNFDDTLGLSPVEELHLASLNAEKANGDTVNSDKDKNSNKNGDSQHLPVTEQLLSDKTEHIFKRTQQLAFDEKFAIKVSVPEHHANLGELYNLSISRGTLTTEDRYIINEHIIGTIKMLDQLPFPPELANVPRYASTHHETLIGTGYPRKLTADDLSIPERVLVIADIFEALTAADRPYKKGKSLSMSVNILHKFALDQHIDIDLFELFLTSGTYLTYANKYMKEELIDEVDINQYIRS